MIAYLEDDGRRVIRKVGEFLSAYKFSHPERKHTAQSPLREPQNSRITY